MSTSLLFTSILPALVRSTLEQLGPFASHLQRFIRNSDKDHAVTYFIFVTEFQIILPQKASQQIQIVLLRA